jgi:hypothetical protein
MSRGFRSVLKTAAVVAAVAIAAPILAQQPAVPGGPTAKNPIRYSAFAISMNRGKAGQVDIAIERWSTDAEREGLLKLVSTATRQAGGQDKLLRALQDISPRVGYIRAVNSLGWDLKYAWKSTLKDGTRQIVIATDKPVSVFSAGTGRYVTDFPFTLIEMRMGDDGKGEGKLLAATSISVENNRLELQQYGAQPVQLTTITEEHKAPKEPKAKSK